MTDLERAFQAHDISGGPTALCDLCGRPVARHSLVPVARTAASVASVGPHRVCPACLTAIERDDLLLTRELDVDSTDDEG